MGIDRPIDITADQYKSILELLKKHLPETAAWAYGSRVKWTARPESDLDLVVFASPKQTHEIVHLKEAFEESDLPFRVDLFEWDSVPEQFRKEIAADHVILQEAHEGQRVPKGWREKKLGDVIELKRGYDLPKRMRKSGKVPVVSSSGITGTHTESKVQRPGVVTGRYGTLGEVFYISEDFWPLNTTLYVQDFKGNDPRFVSYLLRELDTSHYADKAAVPGLNRNHLHQETVCIPTETGEQRAIAHILGTLDDKIELNRLMNETLEAIAQAIFKSWFVDFDPVRAKMEGRLPSLPPELWDLFPDVLNDEDKPVGWAIRPLDKVAKFLNGLALQKFPARNVDDSLPVIKIAELRGGITEKSNRASREVPDDYVVTDGDFLFSWSGSLIAKFWTEGEGALNQHLFKVTSDRYPAWFFSHWTNHHLEQFKAIADSKATTMGHIQRGHLSEAMTNCPPDDVLQVLGETVCPLVERTIKNELEARTLARTRDLLLPKLMSGEIRLLVAEQGLEIASANASGYSSLP